MHLCRSAWQRLRPLTQRGAAAFLRNASARQMSAGGAAGSSGGAMPYYLFVGVCFAGGGVYVYRILSSDKARYHERNELLQASLRDAAEVEESKSITVETNAVSETIEVVVEAAVEEAVAEETTEPEATPSATLEQEQTAVEDGAASAPAEEEPAPSTEASPEQVEPENTESIGETLEESSVVLEASSENITEELASAAEDWSELTARKPEEMVVEGTPVAEVEPENTESVGEILEETSIVLEASSENITEELASAAEDWSELTARQPEEAVVEGTPVSEESEQAVECEEESASS